jgi:imidazolonepropionase-like amidohydrolase
VDAYVAMAKAAGYDHILVWNDQPHFGAHGRITFGPNERAGFDSVLAAARRADLPAGVHDHSLTFDALLALGARGGSVEHLYAFWDSLGFWATRRLDSSATSVPDVPVSKLRALAAATQRAGTWITPTLRCMEANWRSPTHLKVIRQLVEALQDAGVGLLLGQDDGWDAHNELAALVRAGLTPYQALLTGTRNPAQYLDILDSSGTIAVGKRADLVLLHGNPLADVRRAREMAGVMIEGRWLDRVALDQRLLVSPKAWLRSGMSRRGIKFENLKVHIEKVEALADSLAATPSGQDGRRA